MKKIGVLVFTDKAKERGGAKDKKSFDSKKNYGLSVVLSNLNHEYEYTSYKNIDKYDYVLASLTSYYDVYNLIKTIPKEKKCKLIVGGQAVLNIRSYIDIIDFAWFGRCDGEEINYPIDKKKHPSLWSKEEDGLFEKNYIYNEGTLRENGETVFGEKETHIGCRQKCFFCQYSWVNKHKTLSNSSSYQDAYTTKEDFFQCVDWKNIRVLTALDGMTENTRKKINKPLTIETLEKKILETNEIQTEKNITAKIYSVIGFPWEDKDEISKCDLIGILEKNKHNLKNKILFYFHLSHFVPMPKTPLWSLPFSFIDYRKIGTQKPELFNHENRIRLLSGLSNTSPIAAAENLIIQRAKLGDYEKVKTLTTSNYSTSASIKKTIYLKKTFPEFFIEQKKDICENIKTPYNYLNINSRKTA